MYVYALPCSPNALLLPSFFELPFSSPLWKQIVLLSRWTGRLAFLLPSHAMNDSGVEGDRNIQL